MINLGLQKYDQLSGGLRNGDRISSELSLLSLKNEIDVLRSQNESLDKTVTLEFRINVGVTNWRLHRPKVKNYTTDDEKCSRKLISAPPRLFGTRE